MFMKVLYLVLAAGALYMLGTYFMDKMDYKERTTCINGYVHTIATANGRDLAPVIKRDANEQRIACD